MKEPKRKVITVEVETLLSNEDIKKMIRARFSYPWNEGDYSKIIQIQVNEIKKEK